MIRIEIERTGDGGLKRLSARGHALSDRPGADVVCAAATVLVRTAARTLESNPRVRIAGSAESRGELEFEVLSVDPRHLEWLRGVTDSLVRGIEDLVAQHPAKVQLKVNELQGEKIHGS